MNLEVIGAAVAVVGALLWIRRDMRHDIAELRRDLTAQIAAVNTRIHDILLADRKTPDPTSTGSPLTPAGGRRWARRGGCAR